MCLKKFRLGKMIVALYTTVKMENITLIFCVKVVLWANVPTKIYYYLIFSVFVVQNFFDLGLYLQRGLCSCSQDFAEKNFHFTLATYCTAAFVSSSWHCQKPQEYVIFNFFFDFFQICLNSGRLLITWEKIHRSFCTA